MRIAVLIAVRNEASQLRVLLPLLAQQALDVVIIDNDSEDELASVLERHPVSRYQRLPFLGYFSLTQQMEAKRDIIAELDHDWIVHQDADEVLQHADPTRNLRDAICEADAGGYNALNFREFCFIAEPGEDYEGRNYPVEMHQYYHFAPFANRLNRAWQRSANLDSVRSRGHKLTGENINFAPRDHSLRHYLALSQSHVLRKYLNRVFDASELEAGAHINRVGLTREMLELPASSPFLHRLEAGSLESLQTEPVAKNHFWHWTDNELA